MQSKDDNRFLTDKILELLDGGNNGLAREAIEIT